MTEARALTVATGQTWIAGKALELGLIDGIATVQQVLGKMAGGLMANANQGAAVAVETAAEPKAIEGNGQVVANDAPAVAEPVEAAKEGEPLCVSSTSAVAAPEEAKADEAAKPLVPDAAAVVAEETIKNAKTDAYADGLKDSSDRMNAILSVCGDDFAFAVAQFLKGNDKGKAAVEYAAHLKKELQSAKGLETAGAQPVALRTAAIANGEGKTGMASVIRFAGKQSK